MDLKFSICTLLIFTTPPPPDVICQPYVAPHFHMII